jgi:putative salt-induced outer membrane protein
MNAEYVSGRHRSNGEWKFYMLYKDGEEDKRQSSYSAQSDFKLSPKTYLYGNFTGIESRYSAYFKDHTLSGGMGYQLTNTEKLIVELEIGSGFRYQEPNLDEIKDDDIIFPETVQEGIFRGNINVEWKVVNDLKLSADITTVTGHSNTRWDTNFSTTNNITEDIALKLAYVRQYHDKVPEGLSNADSIFSVNLLFIF